MPHVENVPIILKRTSVPGKVPTLGDLQYGELALNYADGILRFKTASNEIAAFPQSRKNITPAWAPSMTIDLLAGRVDLVRVTLLGNTTFTFTNAVDNQRFVLELTQDGVGNRTYSWDTPVRQSVAFSRSYLPSSTAGLMDRFGFIYRNSGFDLAAQAFGFTS